MKQSHIYLKCILYWTFVTIVTLILCINWIHIVLFHSCIWCEQKRWRHPWHWSSWQHSAWM